MLLITPSQVPPDSTPNNDKGNVRDEIINSQPEDLLVVFLFSPFHMVGRGSVLAALVLIPEGSKHINMEPISAVWAELVTRSESRTNEQQEHPAFEGWCLHWLNTNSLISPKQSWIPLQKIFWVIPINDFYTFLLERRTWNCIVWLTIIFSVPITHFLILPACCGAATCKQLFFLMPTVF